MGHHEKIWLDDYLSSEVLFYKRYVDDWNNENDELLFFDNISTRRPNVRFTMEREVEKKLPLLNMMLDNGHSFVITIVFRKKRPLMVFLLIISALSLCLTNWD